MDGASGGKAGRGGGGEARERARLICQCQGCGDKGRVHGVRKEGVAGKGMYGEASSADPKSGWPCAFLLCGGGGHADAEMRQK